MRQNRNPTHELGQQRHKAILLGGIGAVVLGCLPVAANEPGAAALWMPRPELTAGGSALPTTYDDFQRFHTAVASGQSTIPDPPLKIHQSSDLPGRNVAQSPADPSPATPIFVERIEVLESTIFDAETLRQTLLPFENRSLTLAELQQAADAVTQLYLNEGYITSRVIIPNQSFEEGVVRLLAVEGTLEAIQVEGAERLVEYVRSRVALGAGHPLNQSQLEDQLRLLQGDPLFDNVEASLRAGSGPNQSVLVVRVTLANPFEGRVLLDTLSPESVGRYRIGAELQYRNLLGWGEQLSATAYRSTTGGSSIYDLRFQVPVNPMDGRVLLRVTPNTYEVTDPDSVSFGLVSGSADAYEAVFRQPLVRTPREEFALSLGFRYRQGNTLLGDVITDSTTTSVFSFGQDYLRRDLQGAWSLRSQFRLGTGLFDATSRSGGQPDGQFLSWIGQVQRVQILNPDHLLVFQGDIQLTGDSLLGSEQFFIGGEQSVRGYYQNQRFGDNGIRFSIEDRITLVRDEGGGAVAQAAPFLEMGYVWFTNPDAAIATQNFMLGTGVGFLFNMAPGLSSRIDFGVPLVAVDEFPDDQPLGLRIYLGADYRF